MGFPNWRGLSDAAVLKTVASYARASEKNVTDEEIAGAPTASKETSLEVTPSADPELWQAIVASLDEQDKRQQRQISRHLSDVSPEVAGRLRQHRQDQLRCSPEGVTFFDSFGGKSGGTSDLPCASSGAGSRQTDGEGGGGGGGSSSRTEDTGSASRVGRGADSLGPSAGSDCGLVLPSFASYPPAVRDMVLSQLCNEYLQHEAESEGVINGVPGCTPQLVLTTMGDGNCLSHSCSLGVWGIHDRDGRLRDAIHATMAHPQAGQLIRARFERQLAAVGVPQEDWAAEWDRELSTCGSSSTYLSDVHAYTLANVLRRPLLLYGDEQASAAALSGVYLPSLWPTPQAQCSRQPLALLFGWSHFSLLATVQGEGPASPPLLPLCTRSGPLQLRFLSAAEAQQAGERSDGGSGSTSKQQLVLLRRYMDAEPIFNGRLGVRLSEAPRPHVLVSLLSSLFLQQAAEQQQPAAAKQEQPAA